MANLNVQYDVSQSLELAKSILDTIQKNFGKQDIINKETKVAVPILKSADELLKEVTFVYYEPNVLDAHGEWCSEATLVKACDNFNENIEKGVVVPNLFHSKSEDGSYAATSTFSVVDSWINKVECIIGDQPVSEGTWLVKVKFKSEALWDLFMEGKVSGVSLGGKGVVGSVE